MCYMKLMMVILTLSNVACGFFIPQKNYLIPKDTRGNVYIFHSVVRGEKVDKIGNDTIFQIPTSRFLISQYIPDESIYIPSYYYIDADGTKSILELERSSLHRTDENLSNPNPFVWFPVSVSSSWSKIPCEVKYERFYVGTRPHMLSLTQKDRDEEYFRFQEFVEANSDLLCEGKPASQTTFHKLPAN